MFKLPFFVFTIKWGDISFSIHQKLLWILSANVMQGLLVLIYFTWFVYLLPRASSLLCTCPAYNQSGKVLARSLFLFGCFLNLITFCAPHLKVLELMALPKTEVLIAKHHPLSNIFSSTLIWVIATFLQAKQRALERVLKKYIFAEAAWSENSEDLMIYALIWNSAISD